MNALIYVVLAVGIAMWAALIHVIVVEPIRLYLRQRQTRQTTPVPAPQVKVLSRP